MAEGQTRARFVRTGAAAIGAAALASAWRTGSADAAGSAAAASVPKGTVSEGAFDARFFGDSFSFELSGAPSGRVDDPSGGTVSADVVTEKLGGDWIAKKHIANIKYEDLSVTAGTGMSKGFYNWIKASFDGKPLRQSGAVVGYSNGQATASGDFFNALITEIGFPALDAGSKDAAKMTIKFKPELTRYSARQGKPPASGGAIPDVATFKLSIDGLPTERVSKIESFTVKQAVVPDDTGQSGFQFQATNLEVPNITFYLAGDIEQAWSDYFDSFVIKGENGQDKERGGSLTYLDKKMQTELFTVTFKQMGIFKLTPEKVEAGSESIRRVKAEMYCEDVRFTYSSAATFG